MPDAVFTLAGLQWLPSNPIERSIIFQQKRWLLLKMFFREQKPWRKWRSFVWGKSHDCHMTHARIMWLALQVIHVKAQAACGQLPWRWSEVLSYLWYTFFFLTRGHPATHWSPIMSYLSEGNTAVKCTWLWMVFILSVAIPVQEYILVKWFSTF